MRGVLFDAGGVLVRPVGGRWNPRYDFEAIVERHHPAVIGRDLVDAFAAGQRVLDAGSTTADRTGYHRAILRELGVGAPSAELLRELAAPAAGPVIELYPDARPALERLRATGVAMAVVSDTWAGLDETFRQLGVAEFFAGFVISELMGCRKPDPRMYAAGSDLLGLTPGECLFIDDDPELVAAAIALGYQGLTLDRDAERPAAGMVTSLDGIP